MPENPEYEEVTMEELQDMASQEDTFDAIQASQGEMALGFDDRHAN